MEQKDIFVRIDGINILEKVLFPTFYTENSTEFNFELKTQSLISNKPNIIATVVSVNIKKLGEDKLTARFTAEFGFEVPDRDNVIANDKEGNSTIPIDLENYLKSISISSMRGIIYSELRGTSLHGAVLPIILIDTLKPIEGSVLDNLKIDPTTTE